MPTTITGLDISTQEINVDSGTLFVDSANNRVGVGTSSPAKALDVAGDNKPEIGLYSTDGSDPAILLGDSNDKARGGLYYDISSNELEVRGYDNETAIRITDSQDVLVENGELVSNVRFRSNVPSDFWTGSDAIFTNQGYIGTNGSFSLSIAGNGYRNNNNEWTSLNLDGSNKACLIDVAGKDGEIRLKASDNFPTGSDRAPPNIATIDANGLSLNGSLSKDSGSFRIDHPLPEKSETHNLVHSFVESPLADNIYRGTATLTNGAAKVNIDSYVGMTEGTFSALNGNTDVFLQNKTGWEPLKGEVIDNILHIQCRDETATDTISWMVVAERQDQHMLDTQWTDEFGRPVLEPEKEVDKEDELDSDGEVIEE